MLSPDNRHLILYHVMCFVQYEHAKINWRALYTWGTFHLAKRFCWKFRKLSWGSFVPVVPNFQSRRLINKGTWWHNDDARRHQNRNGNFVQMERLLLIRKKWTEYLRRSSVYYLHFNKLNRKGIIGRSLCTCKILKFFALQKLHMPTSICFQVLKIIGKKFAG